MPIPLKNKVKNYDTTLVGHLINYVENPDSLGYVNGKWYSPKYDSRFKRSSFDPNNIGMGVDRNTNEYLLNGELKMHKDNAGREYLTELEERNARHHAIANAEESYGNRLAYAQKVFKTNKVPSEMKKALTISAIYNLGQGTVSNELFEDKALMNSFLNGSDIDYSNRINAYYTAHNRANRGPQTNKFIQNYNKKAEGGSLNRSWDDLSLQEKSEMMKVAIQNGITDLSTIRQKYNEFAEGGPEETYNVGYIPEVTIEAERKNNPYIYYDPWSRRYKGIGIGGQRIEYGEGFNPEGSILLPNAQAYENQRLIRAKQDDLNHTNAFANTIRNIALATTVAPMAGPLVEAAQAAAPALAPGSKLWMSPVAKQMMASEIGGRAVDALFINGKTWGENLSPIVNKYTGWNPEDTWYGKALMEATNPGYFMSPTGLMSATGKAVDTAINTTKILSPRYRSLHAYNSINPVGYESPVQRGLVWLDDMIKDNPVDLKRPLFYQRAIAENKGVRPDEGYLRTGNYLEPTVKNRGQISDEARLDAWAIHNNLEPQYGTYIKIGDRKYAYDIPKLMEKSENTLSVYKLPKGNEPGGKGMTDFVTGAGGGLTDFSLVGTDANGNSLIHIEDLWDVNPFKRSTDIISRKLFPDWSSKYGNSLFTKGSRLYDFGEAHNSALLRKIGDKMMADSDEPLLGLLKPLDKKMQEFEVGTITGGKPFLMSTDVPVHAVSTPVRVSDDFALPMTTYRFGYNPNYFVDKSAFEPNYNTINLEDVDLGNLFDNITTTNPVIPKKRR